MSSKAMPKYKHYFKVKGGKFIWEDPDMLEFKRRLLEGKRGYALIEEAHEKVSSNQYAYYFGGIIRRECMASETFKTLSEYEIHQVLFAELRSTTKGVKMPDGTTKLITVTEDFAAYSKKDMSLYLEELIPHLNMEYNIWPKPSSHYKYNRFYFNQKVKS